MESVYANADFPNLTSLPSVPTIRHTHKYSSQHDMFKIEENMPAELKFRTSSSDTLLGIEGWPPYDWERTEALIASVGQLSSAKQYTR